LAKRWQSAGHAGVGQVGGSRSYFPRREPLLLEQQAFCRSGPVSTYFGSALVLRAQCVRGYPSRLVAVGVRMRSVGVTIRLPAARELTGSHVHSLSCMPELRIVIVFFTGEGMLLS
jgi:hypothetical protein